jgi:hypothetical protein
MEDHREVSEKATKMAGPLSFQELLSYNELKCQTCFCMIKSSPRSPRGLIIPEIIGLVEPHGKIHGYLGYSPCGVTSPV